MVDFCNHRRFSLGCLKYDVIPVSIRLKTNIKTTRGLEIIRKAEKQLLNEHIRCINNSLELYVYEKAYFHQLKEKLDNNTMEECQDFINRVVEARHQRVLDCQRSKFESLYHWKNNGPLKHRWLLKLKLCHPEPTDSKYR